MKRILNITIDLKTKIYNTIFLKQMDTTVFNIKIIDDSKVIDFTSQTIDIIFTKPNGTIVQQLASEIDNEKGIATIPLQAECLRQDGQAKMEIEVKNTNEEVISSFYIPIKIEKTSKGNITAEDHPGYFEEFVKNMDEFKAKEEERNLAEKQRQTAETNRNLSEKDRANAESTRVASEKTRENNENTRSQSEQERVLSEKTRQSQETTRENQENVRENNEETRKANELTREKNETQREKNEQAREDYIEQLKQQVLNGEVGNGVESIELINGTHKAGEFDTYQITYTDGTTKEFQVYNGRDGTGVGDMLKATYDADDDGIVDNANHSMSADNAKKVNNHTVESDVPSDAKFTDTTYSKATTTKDGLMSREDKEKIEKLSEEHYYRLDVTQTIADNSEITIPCKYKVGNESLMVFLNGEKLIRATSTQDGSYKEVGSSGTTSSKIQIYEWGCTADPGDVFEFIVKGEYV